VQADRRSEHSKTAHGYAEFFHNMSFVSTAFRVERASMGIHKPRFANTMAREGGSGYVSVAGRRRRLRAARLL
jgi:hypothetical protein